MASKKTIDDYTPLNRLGQGAFAEVYLMRDKSDNCLYAVKKVSKTLLKREGKIEQAIRERELLISLNHQGIVKLHKAFHDNCFLYLVMEYCSKESLSKLLERHGRTFPYTLVKHYTAELVVILEVLRNSSIIHRDIKPENILITTDNHLKLIDFNCAKKLSSRKTIRNTFVGTLSYVAPEVIQNSKVIGPEVDLWSLGCLVYQMLLGKLPFTAQSQEEIYENILNCRYHLPPDINPDVSSLISSLLTFDPEARLGSSSIQDLKNHRFFEGIDFDSLWNNPVPEVLEEIKQEEQKKEDLNGHKQEEPKKEEVLMDGHVNVKKNFLKNENRRLVVTTKPSIKFYSMRTKEERLDLDVKTVNGVKKLRYNAFSIETPKKNYEVIADNPDLWVEKIKIVLG